MPGFFFGGGASLEARHTCFGATAGVTSFGPEFSRRGTTTCGAGAGAALAAGFGGTLAGAATLTGAATLAAGLDFGVALTTGFGAGFAGALDGAFEPLAGALTAGFFFTTAFLLDFAMCKCPWVNDRNAEPASPIDAKGAQS